MNFCHTSKKRLTRTHDEDRMDGRMTHLFVGLSASVKLSSWRSDSQDEDGSPLTQRADMQTELERNRKDSAPSKVLSWWVSVKLHANSVFSMMIYLALAELSWCYGVFSKDCGLVEFQSAMHRWFTFTLRLCYKSPIISHGKVQRSHTQEKLAVTTKDALGK